MNALDQVRVAIRATVQIYIPAIGSLPRVREVSVHHSDVISSLAKERKYTTCCGSGPAPWSPHVTHMPGLAPAIKTMRRAMRLCKFHFSTAAATQMTPTSSSVVFLKYSAATCRESGEVSHRLGKKPWPVRSVLRARGW